MGRLFALVARAALVGAVWPREASLLAAIRLKMVSQTDSECAFLIDSIDPSEKMASWWVES